MEIDTWLRARNLPYDHHMTSTSTSQTPSRVWFATGASSGIGRELARQALEAGEAVAAVARSTANLADLGEHDLLLKIDADVRDEAAVQAAVGQAIARFGRIDVVANNAGLRPLRSG